MLCWLLRQGMGIGSRFRSPPREPREREHDGDVIDQLAYGTPQTHRPGTLLWRRQNLLAIVGRVSQARTAGAFMSYFPRMTCKACLVARADQSSRLTTYGGQIAHTWVNWSASGHRIQEGYRELYRDLSFGKPSYRFFRHAANIPTKY